MVNISGGTGYKELLVLGIVGITMMLSNEPVIVVGSLNELKSMTKRTTTKPDVAYVVIRSHYNGEEWIGETPVAICEFLEDADNMATKYNQEMLDRNIDSLSFNVIVCPFYD